MAGLEQAIACGNGERAARMIQEALGIESAEVANSQVIPKSFPCHGRRIASAPIIGEWLQTEARSLA